MRALNVLLVCTFLVAGFAGPAQSAKPGPDPIAKVAEDDGRFTTLLEALGCTGLAPTFAGNQGRYTVFAPTDEAFAALDLDATNVCDLDLGALTGILAYHVTLGTRLSQSVLGAGSVRMLDGNNAWVYANADGAFINEAQLLAPELIDIRASNGVIHAIDAVLMPPTE